MQFIKRFCNWLNMLFIPSIPETSRSLLKDLMSIGVIPEEDNDGWKCFKEK